jgi:signal transduction histidine kinase
MRLPSGIARTLSSAFHAGVDGSMDPRRAKRIVLSNQISLSIALLSMPYVLIYLFSGAGLMGWLEIPIFLGYASVHRFNKAGYTWFSRAGLITLANLDILIYTVSMGKALGINLLYLAGGLSPLVLFNAEEKKSIVYGVALSSLLLLATEIFVPDVGLFQPIRPESVHGMRVLEIATITVVMALLIFYFLQGNRRTEIALAEAGEAAREADLAKSRFLDRMSGEIRAPLNEILSLSHLLLKSGLGAERRETVEDIQLSAQDLMIIVDELLDLSRLESGRMRLESLPFSPVRVGHAVLRPFEFESGRKGLRLILETDPALPAHLVGDAARLKQVLRNLLGNAFKFTESGKVILRIRGEGEAPASAAGPEREDRYLLAFEVEDTGIGVPEAARARIFEPFSQADASTTRKYGGTGLGLFISKQIVEMMGGTIGLRPRPEGGTIFRFSVPLLRAENAPMQPAAVETPPAQRREPRPPAAPEPAGPAREEAMPPAARFLKVLVVDDHPMNRKLLGSFLSGYGLNADLAASAQEALASCEAAAYHLVFMDCHMPGMDGYECTRLLRQGPRAGTRPTIIGVTADTMNSNLRRCLDAGMDALLVKPIIEKQLRDLIVECAGRLGGGA